jgi:ABC-type branched-subunit amino acid transport system substrate-binding protein
VTSSRPSATRRAAAPNCSKTQSAGIIKSPDFTAVQEFDAMHAVYAVAEALHGDLSDADKVMAVVKGMKFESPRGPFAIGASTRDAVQNVYLRRLTRANGFLENVEFETVPMLKDPTETYEPRADPGCAAVARRPVAGRCSAMAVR